MTIQGLYCYLDMGTNTVMYYKCSHVPNLISHTADRVKMRLKDRSFIMEGYKTLGGGGKVKFYSTKKADVGKCFSTTRFFLSLWRWGAKGFRPSIFAF